MSNIKVIKRDGRKINFNPNKIEKAILGATMETYGKVDNDKVKKYTNEVVDKLKHKQQISVEEIQDIVQKVLIDNNEYEIVESFIIYRNERTEIREANSELMLEYKDLTFKDSKQNSKKRENANIDSNTSMGTMLQFGSTGAKKLALKHILDRDHALAHKNGSIHIHDLDFEAIGTTTCLVGDTFITLKDKNGKIINTTINYFNDVFNLEDNENPEWKEISNYYILGRNGWTKLEKVMRRKLNHNDKLYNLKTHKGLGLRVTANHRIPIIRDGEEKLLHVKDIEIGDSLLSNPKINIIDQTDTLNLVEEFNKCEHIDSREIYVCNIRKLKQYMNYKYDIDNLSEFIKSKTYRNGTSYIDIEQFQYLIDNFDIPYEVLISLEIKIKGGKHRLPVIFPITHELVKLMGYIYSDGCVSKDGRGITFINTNPDILANFKECYNKVCLTPLTIRRNGNNHCGWFSNNSMLNYLISRVLGYKYKANNMIMPNFIFNSSDEMKFSFISGLTDGDGCVSGGWGYSSVCISFLEQLTNLLKTLNIDTKVEHGKSKGTFTGFKDSYRNFDGGIIRTTDAKNSRLILEGLNGIKRNESYLNDIARIGNTVKYDVNKIKDKIEIQEDCYVYDLQTVEHWFIANNYVVHNCTQIDIDSLFKGGFSTGHGFLREPQDIISYTALAAIAIQSNQNDQHGEIK